MSTEGFSSDLAEETVSKYDEQSNIGADIVGGTIASVVDFGASVWNSLTPKSMETSTQDLLSNIDSNALRVYQENPDIIQAASFVGGMLVPTGLAMKGMQAARSGMKGVNFFSEAGQVSQRSKVAEAFANAGLASTEYKSAVTGLYAMSAANAIADGVAIEASMLLTMNAHPFMEDYVKDPVKHFATSVALMGGFGGAIGHVIERSAIKGIKMGVESEAMAVVRAGDKDVSAIENLSGQIAARSRNVENWENILNSTKTLPDGTPGPVRELNAFTKNMLETFALKEKEAIVLDFEKMASKEILDLPVTTRNNLINLMAENPDRFAGIDSIRFASAAEELPATYKAPRGLVDSTSQKPFKLGEAPKDLNLPLADVNTKGKDVGVTMIYSPKFDSFMLSSDLKHYGTAVDLIQNEAHLTSGLQNNWHMLPRYDQILETAIMSTAAVDADYLKALKYYDSLDIEAFKKAAIAISPDDTAVLSAVYARMQKEITANPDILNDLKVILTKEQPNFSLTGEKVLERVITNTITKTVTNGGSGTVTRGIGKDALDKMTSLLRGPSRDTMDLMYAGNSLSPEARDLAQSFSTDQMWPLHNGLEIARRKNAIPQKLMSETQAKLWGSDNYKAAIRSGKSHREAMEAYGHETSNLGKYVEEILRSPESQKLKSQLVTDGEGYTYLYRGMRGKAQGHSPGESYTPDYRVALRFAGGEARGVSLYKVHLDEVVGFLGKFGGSAGGEAEIVLDVPTRIVAGKPQIITGTSSSGHSVTEVLTGTEIKEAIKSTFGKQENIVGMDGVFENLIKSKQSRALSLMQQGVPFETISLHTNIPLETIEALAGTGTKDLLSLNKPLSTYNDASSIGRYMSTDNRALAVSTNLDKVPLAKIKAGLQAKNLDDVDSIAKNAMMMGSRSETVREIGKYLTSDTISAQLSVLRAEINRVTDSAVGTKMFASSDFALRDLGAVGAVATSIGKDVVELVNKRVAALWEPMKVPFNTISKDAAATVELNTAMKVNASLKGYREFQGSKLMVQDINSPWIEIKDAAGKVVGKNRNMIPATYKGKDFEIVTPSVLGAVTKMQDAGRELYEMRNSINAISGRSPVNDMGFWAPPFNPRSKMITYVWDKVEDKTTLLFGKNPEELQTAVNAFKSTLAPGELERRYQLIDKSDQVAFNKMQGRHDNVFMSSADSSTFHSGSSAAEIVSTNADVLTDLANGYDHYIGYGVRSMLDVQLSDVMSKMDQLSYLSQQHFRDQPLNQIQKMLQKPKDPGKLMKNTLMGNSNLDQSIFWERLSEVTGGVSETALTTINNLVEPILNTGKSFFGKGKSASNEKYEALTKDLERRGIPNPFEVMDDHLAKEIFHVQSISQAPNMTPRILALSNAAAATTMLRFMELGQPLINAISLPILTSAAMGRKMEKAFMGGVLDESAKFGVIEAMYNGIRFGGDPHGKALVKMAEEAGIFKPLVSEATEAMSQVRNLTPGLITSVEKALESTLVKTLSAGADYSETLVRKTAFQTGAYMAKKAYPGISDAGIITFARDFVDQAIGNYSSAQRPIMFQGTLGVAMGLFQTYMLTMAQDIYRIVENKNWSALAKTMLTQQTIFGAKSLPGFNYVSEMIGDQFSDKNVDLITGTYRALPKGLADLVIYGLPSSLGPAITTRGEIQPRIPNVLGEGLNAIPAFNILKQTFAAADRVTSAAFTADASTGKAMLEALSLQSISRPVARMSELLTGHSITQKGNLVAGPEDIYTTKGVMARVFATRPLEETKSRDAIHLNSFYGSLDKKARDKLTDSLKTHIRDNNLTPELVEELGNEYMRTGSPSGYRSAVNHAIGQTAVQSGSTVRNYLKPNSPFHIMLDDLD